MGNTCHLDIQRRYKKAKAEESMQPHEPHSLIRALNYRIKTVTSDILIRSARVMNGNERLYAYFGRKVSVTGRARQGGKEWRREMTITAFSFLLFSFLFLLAPLRKPRMASTAAMPRPSGRTITELRAGRRLHKSKMELFCTKCRSLKRTVRGTSTSPWILRVCDRQRRRWWARTTFQAFGERDALRGENAHALQAGQPT